MRERLRVFGMLAGFYAVAVVLGMLSAPGHRHASGIVDLGHHVVPALIDLVGEHRAEWVWWLGTLPLELFFVVIAGVVLLTGKSARLALCLYAMYALHWLCILLTTLPAPDQIVWRFPDGILTLGNPTPRDLWFSGHVANAFVIALATRGARPWVRAIAWGLVAFQIVLVLSTRTHYSIDVVGGLFVGYTAHRISLDLLGPDA